MLICFALQILLSRRPAPGYPNASGAGSIGGLFSQAIGIGYYGYEYAKPLHFTDKLRSEGYVQFPSAAGENFHLGWTTRNGIGWREPNTLAFRFVRGAVPREV